MEKWKGKINEEILGRIINSKENAIGNLLL